MFQTITLENYSDAFLLQETCHQFPWSEKVFVDCLTEPYFCEHLLVDGKVTGYYVGLLAAVEATLMDIGIAEQARGQGHGRKLLERFIEQCESRKALDCWLEVRASNAAALHLYRSYEFELIETRKNYYPADSGREDALIMKKILA
ncbi:MAG: ribosomal-protein-alanine N-acetyltransferase [Alteromonadaceae bacterium]|nr:ribosomal-protein-alanine N-acetyltransferase [Alteromonadaceae bacterium]